MPLELEIIRAAEFVRVGAQGQFDLAASKAALATLAEACRKRGIHNAVMDLRAVQPGPKPVFTPADLLELVKLFPEVGFDQRRLRLAILYRSDPHKRARLFSFLSTLHGWSVRAVGDFETALRWLSDARQAPALIPPGPHAGQAQGAANLPHSHTADAVRPGASRVGSQARPPGPRPDRKRKPPGHRSSNLK